MFLMTSSIMFALHKNKLLPSLAPLEKTTEQLFIQMFIKFSKSIMALKQVK